MQGELYYAVTGHRPDKLPDRATGYTKAAQDKLFYFAQEVLRANKPTRVMVGMAQGWDQAVARACTVLGIPWSAAVPCDDQDSQWPPQAQRDYRTLLKHAYQVTIVSPGMCWSSKMQKRNEYMVDWADQNDSGKLLALWNGSSGGTANCVKYALKQGVPTLNAWSWWTGQTKVLLEVSHG